MGVKKLIGNPLNNVQLTSILKYKMGHKFKGCFARSELPKSLNNGYYVLNLDNNTGTHWTGFIVSNHEIEYFDPFGFPPPNEVIARIGRRQVIYSTHSLQNLLAVSCGLWVVWYLWNRYDKLDRIKLLLQFDNNGSQYNERKLKQWVLRNLINDK